MEGPDTFTQLPITIDPTTKAISSSDHSLLADLDALNTLHRAFLKDLDNPLGVPPPPVPVNPKRTAQMTKLKETGNASFKKGAYADAVRMYTLAIEMAIQRPVWEPAGLVREELSMLYNNRSQGYMAQQMWAEGGLDAYCSTELKKVGNVKGWWRRGTCLKEMGRLAEAGEVLREGIDFEGAGPDKEGVKELAAVLKEVDEAVEKRGVVV